MGTLSWPEVIIVLLSAAAFGVAGIALYFGPAATGKWLQSKFRR